MRIAFVILCFGAVTFLLRVLVAMVKEGKSGRRRAVIYFAIFRPSGPKRRPHRDEASSSTGKIPARNGRRIAG